jgi:deazaflavin-dependent oxidoreductase (nitroreductase family)
VVHTVEWTTGEHPPNLLQRGVQRAAATLVASAVLAAVLPHVDRAVLRLTRGRRTATSALTGLPVVFLTTIGARSGRRRTTPLVAIFADGAVLVVASNFGNKRDPVWCLNLRANPHATVTYLGSPTEVAASEVRTEEYAAYWSMALATYAGFAAYARRASGRHIPLLLLRRRPAEVGDLPHASADEG